MALTPASRNLVTVVEVSYADDPQIQRFSSPRLIWIPVIISLDEIDPRFTALTICEAVRDGPRLKCVPGRDPLLSLVMTSGIYIEASQHSLVVTLFELGPRKAIMRYFHLRFKMATEWATFLVTALQVSVATARFQSDINGRLRAAATAMCTEPADDGTIAEAVKHANNDDVVNKQAGVEHVAHAHDNIDQGVPERAAHEQNNTEQVDGVATLS
ncbi:hypothetical protein OH76DRAFT_1487955 [Lentinus brumalis]|uniref:Uncharacterized protein n=1 Tax=Lentinus brumalis TaxID=2498619 RepID=A0A371CSY7_9APHY|nr:hypothetical protein OH76DRAFT_1487955 [Polyporus brumalis]